MDLDISGNGATVEEPLDGNWAKPRMDIKII